MGKPRRTKPLTCEYRSTWHENKRLVYWGLEVVKVKMWLNIRSPPSRLLQDGSVLSTHVSSSLTIALPVTGSIVAEMVPHLILGSVVCVRACACVRARPSPQ